MNRPLIAVYAAFALLAAGLITLILLNPPDDPNTDNARDTVQHAGVSAGVTPGPDWKQP